MAALTTGALLPSALRLISWNMTERTLPQCQQAQESIRLWTICLDPSVSAGLTAGTRLRGGEFPAWEGKLLRFSHSGSRALPHAVSRLMPEHKKKSLTTALLCANFRESPLVNPCFALVTCTREPGEDGDVV